MKTMAQDTNMAATMPPTSGDTPTQTTDQTDVGSQTIEIPIADFGSTVPSEGDEVRLTIVSVDQNAGTVTAEIVKEAPAQDGGIKGAASKFEPTQGI
jgi:hypothetical protein